MFSKSSDIFKLDFAIKTKQHSLELVKGVLQRSYICLMGTCLWQCLGCPCQLDCELFFLGVLAHFQKDFSFAQDLSCNLASKFWVHSSEAQEILLYYLFSSVLGTLIHPLFSA